MFGLKFTDANPDRISLPHKKIVGLCSRSMVLIVLVGFAAPAMAQSDWNGHRPYGDYCRGSRSGWYGGKREVTSAAEAKRILQDYYTDEDVTISRIVIKENYFEAEILDRNNRVVDRIIVDRRTGRIRSIY